MRVRVRWRATSGLRHGVGNFGSLAGVCHSRGIEAVRGLRVCGARLAVTAELLAASVRNPGTLVPSWMLNQWIVPLPLPWGLVRLVPGRRLWLHETASPGVI
jgi:hypothetical protein